ncbi:MAG: RidA family protein [Firmicutes bacterium]|nr:RidA family protein [Alicyclobacillaceae bacterium]MCL6496767.1 RidA family protein [Bacillota bacterium]
MAAVSERLKALGLELPEPPAPVALYRPARVVGSLCFTAGQLPFRAGRLLAEGRVGREVDVATAWEGARQAALNAMAAAAAAAGGVDRLAGVVQVVGYVQSAEDFHQQAEVLNGASSLFVELFGDAGGHVRSAVGVAALPLNAAVEVECIFALE